MGRMSAASRPMRCSSMHTCNRGFPTQHEADMKHEHQRGCEVNLSQSMRLDVVDLSCTAVWIQPFTIQDKLQRGPQLNTSLSFTTLSLKALGMA